MQTRLVDQDMRHFRAVVSHVLHTAHAFDVLRVCRVGHPKRGLVDPIGFALDLVGKPKCLKHFHCAGVDSVCLALDDVAGHALGDHHFYLWELRQLRSQAKACRACTRNQHIYFFWQGLVDAAVASVGCGWFDVWTATTKSVFVKLHVLSPILIPVRNLGMNK